jgi:transposase
LNNEPEIVLDDEHELVIERVAAIDVAKASGKVCMRMPHPSRPDRRMSKVRDVDATTRAVTELADDLLGEGVERVTVESTSDYWRIWFYLLEAAGLEVQLVNARDVKHVPGRAKTDSMRCGWPSSPRRVCCDRVSCLRHRSGSCVTTPGFGWI